MKISLNFVGVVLSIAICVFSLFLANQDLLYFVSYPSLLLVIGGTFSLGLVCFPARSVIGLYKLLLKKLVGDFSKDPIEVVREISQLGRALRADPEYLKNPAVKVKTLFLRDAIEIIQRGGVSEERLAGILHRRSETLLSRHNDDFMMISVIEKIPMALGTLGSILSLVHQFHDAAAFEAQIQTNSAFQALFFSLSRASVPLIYGIIFSQFFLVPLRNKIAKLNQADHMIRQIVTDGAVLLLKKEHPVLIDDHLKSYLTPGEQAQLKA